MEGDRESEGGSVDSKAAEKVETVDTGFFSTSDFIIICLARHYSMDNLSMYKYPKLRDSHNLFQVLIGYMIVGIPIAYMEVFLGQYTNMGVLYLKYMVPIANGLGYTLILQAFLTSSVFAILMTQYLIYVLLSISTPGILPWLECHRNFSAICFSGMAPCETDEPCISSTKHLASYYYWNEVYMKGVSSRENAHLGIVTSYRIWVLVCVWVLIWCTLNFQERRTFKFVKRTYCIIMIYKIILFLVILIRGQLIIYFQELIRLNMQSFISYKAWNYAILKVTMGMGLGDFTYMLFGMRSKRERTTGSLLAFCGVASFILTTLDHYILSGATYLLCDLAKLPIEDRYLLLEPRNFQREFGLMPILLGTMTHSGLWTTSYFQSRFLVLLFHLMLMNRFLFISVYQRFPILRIYGVYIKFAMCGIGLLLSIILDSNESFPMKYDLTEILTQFCCQCNILLLTIFVVYIYGVSKFCDDIHFMSEQVPTVYWKFVWILSPLIIFLSLPPNLFAIDALYGFRTATIIIIYLPSLFAVSVAIITKIRQKTLFTLLKATEEWSPLDPTLKLYRKTFNPRGDSKRKNRCYKCVHQCLIDVKIPETDDEDDEFD